MNVLLIVGCVLSCFCVGQIVCDWDVDFSWNQKLNICEAARPKRVDWIIHVRNADYGWDEHTHRANIALAVNRYSGSPEDMKKMVLQLEVEIMKAYFSGEIHENDLALYIHALIATCKNPRDFHGTDLVAELLERVNRKIHNRQKVHPFLVLALCNSRVVELKHLESITVYTEHIHQHSDLDGQKAELKALTLKTFACAADVSQNLNKFSHLAKLAAECLTRRQNDMKDGSFGNVYTTSLAIQALKACQKTLHHVKECGDWDETMARNYVLDESDSVNMNMIKAYYIEMALNAESVTYVKDLCPINTGPPEPPVEETIDMQYSIRESRSPYFYFTLTTKVPKGSNLFEIMETSAKLSDRFRFGYTRNHDNLPMVHMVSGIPNDAEENLFWRICVQYNVTHTRHTSKTESIRYSPAEYIPSENDHLILWYLNTECPQ